MRFHRAVASAAAGLGLVFLAGAVSAQEPRRRCRGSGDGCRSSSCLSSTSQGSPGAACRLHPATGPLRKSTVRRFRCGTDHQRAGVRHRRSGRCQRDGRRHRRRAPRHQRSVWRRHVADSKVLPATPCDVSSGPPGAYGFGDETPAGAKGETSDTRRSSVTKRSAATRPFAVDG